MNNLLRRCLHRAIRLCDAPVAEELVLLLQIKLGIGSGVGPDCSGETIAFELIGFDDKDEAKVVFDVGANKGQFATSILSSEFWTDNIQLHCFEPSKAAFKILTGNLAAQENLVLNNFGLSNEKAKSTLYMDQAASGMASLTRRDLRQYGVDHGRVQETVELSTLDSYRAEHGIGRIQLLKIDVEGHELDVLQGAASTFDADMIDTVLFEFGGCNIDTKTYLRDYFYFFQNMKFSLFRILPSKKLFPIREYREFDESFRTTNFLAVRQSGLIDACRKISVK